MQLLPVYAVLGEHGSHLDLGELVGIGSEGTEQWTYTSLLDVEDCILFQHWVGSKLSSSSSSRVIEEVYLALKFLDAKDRRVMQHVLPRGWLEYRRNFLRGVERQWTCGELTRSYQCDRALWRHKQGQGYELD